MTNKRITLFAGHYGAGKTNIAVNFALWLKSQGEAVLLADLDIVNPYFRTKDSQELVESQGVELIASDFASSNVDLPALPAAMYRVLDQKTHCAVMDIGGDDRGAFALGRYRDDILAENDYEFLAVINQYRPLAADLGDALEILREIEAAAGIPITALVNNSNLGRETTSETVLNSVAYAEKLAEMAGVSLKMTTVVSELYEALAGKIPDLFPLTLQERTFF